MGQWSHGICPSADNPAPPQLSFSLLGCSGIQEDPATLDTGHCLCLWSHMVLPSLPSPQRTRDSILGLVGLSVFSEYLSVTRIPECRNLENWGQGSILQMGTMGKDPELKVLMLQSTLVCRVVGTQVCWAASRATPLCCLESSCQLLGCVCPVLL